MRKSRISPQAPSFQENARHTVCFEVITPMFGGGAFLPSEEAKSNLRPIDPNHPIRITAIRGQLRFWWRAIVSPRCSGVDELHRREAQIWGSTNTPGAVGTSLEGNFTPKPYKIYDDSKNRPLNDKRDLAYACFPLQRKGKNLRSETLQSISGQGKLHLDFSSSVGADERADVEAAVQAWLLFGGVGGRTRRGLGAVAQMDEHRKYIEHSAQSIELFVTTHGLQSAVSQGLTGVPHLTTQFKLQGKKSDSIAALRAGIAKLQHFRQGKEVGRNRPQPDSRKPKPAGRSRWPEPDMLRRIEWGANIPRSTKHRPEHPVHKFPRAQFGLPIIFHFSGNDEPKEATLQPKRFERMASPLIIRPIRVTGGFAALAVLLHEKKRADFAVELKGKREGIDHRLSVQEAQQIRPIAENGGSSDPLVAFLQYFAKTN